MKWAPSSIYNRNLEIFPYSFYITDDLTPIRHHFNAIATAIWSSILLAFFIFGFWCSVIDINTLILWSLPFYSVSCERFIWRDSYQCMNIKFYVDACVCQTFFFPFSYSFTYSVLVAHLPSAKSSLWNANLVVRNIEMNRKGLIRA